MAIDRAAAYASAIRTPDLMPYATIVVDHFHLVKLANDALTKVRRRVTWDLHDRRGPKIDPEWANRRRLLTARERLSPKSFAKMWNTIEAEDPSAQILTAWIAKEELRTLLSTVRLRGDPHLTRHRLHRFLAGASTRRSPNCSPSPPPSTPGGPRSTRSCRPASPMPTEGYNRLLKQVKRVVRIPQQATLGPPDTIPLHPTCSMSVRRAGSAAMLSEAVSGCGSTCTLSLSG